MHFQLTAILALASLTIATPTWSSLEQWKHSPGGKSSPNHTSPRPSVSCYPKHPSKPAPSPPARNKVCYVNSHGNGTDDSPYILDAFHSCNNGGHVVFKEGTQYIIGTAMDWTFLNHIDIGMKLYKFYSLSITDVARYPRIHSIHQ